MNTPLPLILGSSSIFRQQQLRTLGLPFQTARPDFDETPEPGEAASQTALRLAIGKARSLAGTFARALIIGADQVACCNGRQLGKPDAMIEKIVEGQISKFQREVVLLKQPFVMNPDQTVEQMVAEAGKTMGSPIRIAGFVRLGLGEGVEKKTDDFAAEVAAMTNA